MTDSAEVLYEVSDHIAIRPVAQEPLHRTA